MAKDRAVPLIPDRGGDQSVFQTLVIAFGVIVSDVFSNGTAQRSLPNVLGDGL